jgi:hypothetical protein
MGSALVIVGIALVLAVQIAMHLRSGRIAAQVASTDHRAQLGAAEERARLAEEQGAAAARLAEEQGAAAAVVLSEIRAFLRALATTSGKLAARETALGRIIASGASAADMRAVAEAMIRLAEQLRARPAPAPPASAAEDPDERKTIEMPPPAPGSSTAPPAAAAPTPPARAPAAAPAPTGVDDSWDSEETTTVKELTPEDLRIALGGQPSAPARHAQRPPPMADADGDAMDRRSILPGGGR